MTDRPTGGRLETWRGAASEVRVRCFDSPAEAGAYVAAHIAAALSEAIEARGQALWLGCGGTTPKPVYERLAEAKLDWDVVQLAQVDERFVPTDDARSNTLMMREALEPILSLDGEPGMELLSLIEDITDQGRCAEEAEATLLEIGKGAPPVFDIALLGIGPDAHFASIFPNNAINAVIYDTKALVLPVAPNADGAEPIIPRITLSVPAINNSRRILFFITGQAKLDILRQASLSTDPYASPIGAFLAQCPVPVDFIWAA